jgi:hypothetical protein
VDQVVFLIELIREMTEYQDAGISGTNLAAGEEGGEKVGTDHSNRDRRQSKDR